MNCKITIRHSNGMINYLVIDQDDPIQPIEDELGVEVINVEATDHAITYVVDRGW